jgi:hypothetical protein
MQISFVICCFDFASFVVSHFPEAYETIQSSYLDPALLNNINSHTILTTFDF